MPPAQLLRNRSFLKLVWVGNRPWSIRYEPMPPCSRPALRPRRPTASSRASLLHARPRKGGECQWASKMAGFWAPKVSGSERCPAEGAERPEWGSGPGARRLSGRWIRRAPSGAPWLSRQGSLWRERPPPREGKGVVLPVTLYPSPVPHQRSKRGGRSLHQHPSRAARRRAGREGDTRGAASLRLFAADAENACPSASDAAFRENP